jgi:hypothetical protein
MPNYTKTPAALQRKNAAVLLFNIKTAPNAKKFVCFDNALALAFAREKRILYIRNFKMAENFSARRLPIF